MDKARAFLLVCAGLLGLAAALLPAPVSAQAPQYLYQWGTQGNGNGQFNLAPDVSTGVAVDGDGSVYVADGYNNRIQKFTNSGAYLAQWGSYGSGNGQFNLPTGVAVDGGYNVVYVADGSNNRIQKFTFSGTYLGQWGSYGSGEWQFIFPEGVAVDYDGNVYVADRFNYRIQAFTSGGAYLTQWGTPGYENGQFVDPIGVAVDRGGNVYVADSGNLRIQKFTSSGAYLTQWESGGNGVAVDGDGNVYVADGYNNRIQKFTLSGTYLTQWGSYGSGNGQFDAPYGVAVDPDGHVYVADSGNNRIQVFGPVTADVPSDAPIAFGLDPVRPNPARGGALMVHFTLPIAATASLELLDVAGRLVAEREVGSLGAGRHRLDLGEGRRLASGLYLVRLTQGANVRVTRVAVLK